MAIFLIQTFYIKIMQYTYSRDIIFYTSIETLIRNKRLKETHFPLINKFDVRIILYRVIIYIITYYLVNKNKRK